MPRVFLARSSKKFRLLVIYFKREDQKSTYSSTKLTKKKFQFVIFNARKSCDNFFFRVRASWHQKKNFIEMEIWTRNVRSRAFLFWPIASILKKSFFYSNLVSIECKQNDSTKILSAVAWRLRESEMHVEMQCLYARES